jgi:transcriptional regulator with XRE-family HTH domain
MRQMDEKQAFAARLQQALKRSPKKIRTAHDLAVQFSLRHPETSITTAAAHKWLTGRSRPTADKLQTLALWLNVTPTWLLYGDSPALKSATQEQNTASIVPTAAELQMIKKVRALPEFRQMLVQEIIEVCSIDTEVERSQ